MLNFFRKIRRGLLSEKRAGQYLKYAIGEIVLVVIGILIALQLDNWNDEKKAESLLQDYLTTIATNIENDAVVLRDLESRRNTVQLNAVKAMGLIKADQYPATDLDFLFGSMLSAFQVSHFYAESTGFETLRNSGLISRIQGTDLESALFEYYNLSRIVYDYESDYKNYISTLQLELAKSELANTFNRIAIGANGEINTDPEYFQEHEAIYRALFGHPSLGAIQGRHIADVTLQGFYGELSGIGREIREDIEKVIHDH